MRLMQIERCSAPCITHQQCVISRNLLDTHHSIKSGWRQTMKVLSSYRWQGKLFWAIVPITLSRVVVHSWRSWLSGPTIADSQKVEALMESIREIGLKSPVSPSYCKVSWAIVKLQDIRHAEPSQCLHHFHALMLVQIMCGRIENILQSMTC